MCVRKPAASRSVARPAAAQRLAASQRQRTAPGHGTVEQHARPIGARPAERIEPAVQPELDRRLGEGPITIALADFDLMPPAPLARLIGGDLVLGLDADLLADEGLHAQRRLAQ